VSLILLQSILDTASSLKSRHGRVVVSFSLSLSLFDPKVPSLRSLIHLYVLLPIVKQKRSLLSLSAAPKTSPTVHLRCVASLGARVSCSWRKIELGTSFPCRINTELSVIIHE